MAENVRYDYIEVGFTRTFEGKGEFRIDLRGGRDYQEEYALTNALYELWKRRIKEENDARQASLDLANPGIVG